MATEFETFFVTDWPAMTLAEVDAESHEHAAAYLWEREVGRYSPGLMERFRQELSSTVIPPEAWSHSKASKTEPADLSWDRRAAWMVYVLMRARGQTLNASSDLFG